MGRQMPRCPDPGVRQGDARGMASSQSFISRLYKSVSKGLPFVEPVPALRADESELVRGVLQMMQGFSNTFFSWDGSLQMFSVKNGVYVSHLSQAGLYNALDWFVFSATCLKLVELFTKKVEAMRDAPPTLRAFGGCVSMWLKRLRTTALEEEMKSTGLNTKTTTTLLGLGSSLSSICSGAEYLLQIVQGAIPGGYFDTEPSVPSADCAVYILDHLFLKLNEVCLVLGGEEEAYHMLLTIFSGTLLPYIEMLDTWLYDGSLDDPCEELFFYANKAVSVDQPEFWEKSYLYRSFKYKYSDQNTTLLSSHDEPAIHDNRKIYNREPGLAHNSLKERDQNGIDSIACPLLLKDAVRAIVSAGKSLQLVRHKWGDCSAIFNEDNDNSLDHFVRPNYSTCSSYMITQIHKARKNNEHSNSFDSENMGLKTSDMSSGTGFDTKEACCLQNVRVLTLSEVFLISLVGLIEDGSRICEYITNVFLCREEISKACKMYVKTQKNKKENGKDSLQSNWFTFVIDTIVKKGRWLDIENEFTANSAVGGVDCLSEIMDEVKRVAESCGLKRLINNGVKADEVTHIQVFCPENPAITVSGDFLSNNKVFWDDMNISMNFHLPPLNDETLREAIFGISSDNPGPSGDQLPSSVTPRFNGTNFSLGFSSHQFGDVRLLDDAKTLQSLYPFPTLLPSFQENLSVSEVIPFQKNSTLSSRILNWIQSNKPKAIPLPAVIIQECLIIYIRNQVDYVGKHILLKLMTDWKLMDELNVLRSIYLLGSGDLLQQFLLVIFDKIDKGDSWDDDFELNTILQESIRNSADGTVLSAPDSLIVSIANAKHNISDEENHATGMISTPRKVRTHAHGIDALDNLSFTYKVSWPLDLIINGEAIKKYNQVMSFLLKVKRAKFVLDKTRRWMWKCRGSMSRNSKHHLLVGQKLLHFVDAFHQYVMDRVFHSAWVELSTGMESAGSLDEVIEVHEAYLLSIQRQCFVASDKLWALIASRVKIILGLALDFCSIQHTLINGGSAPAIKARCEMEVDRREKEFDECIAFLLRILSFKLNVGHFPHLADLVTRINYNYFYMSDNGNLLTIPSFETTGPKLAKTFPTRTDSL